MVGKIILHCFCVRQDTRFNRIYMWQAIKDYYQTLNLCFFGLAFVYDNLIPYLIKIVVWSSDALKQALKPWPCQAAGRWLPISTWSCNLSLSWPVCRCFSRVLWAGLMWHFSVLLCFCLSVVAAVSNRDACWGIKLLLGCSSLSNTSFYSTSLFICYFLATHFFSKQDQK